MRGRLFLLVAALVLPSWVIISALTWEALRAQQRAVRAEVANTARAVASLVDAEIERSVAMLRAITASRSLQNRDWKSLDESARRVLGGEHRWLAVVDMQGRQLVNTHLPRGVEIPSLQLDPQYLAAMQAGEVFVSNLLTGAAAKTQVVHVGIPIRHPSGELYGFSIVMVPDALRDSLLVRRFAPDGVVVIVDRDGRIIARNPGHAEYVGRLAAPDIVRVTREQPEGVGESVTLENIPVLVAFSRAACGWSVAIGTPKAKVYASTRRLLFIGIGSSLLVALAAVGLAGWIATAVVRSVDELAADAERLARDEPPLAAASDIQEIATVSQAMRRLAATKTQAEAELRIARDRLQEYAQELERRVAERTASLRDAVAQMEEFSYTVSHDLRAPLRAMSGFAEILLEEHGAALDEEARSYLLRIVRASDRMKRLTTDLLHYSRVARADVRRSRVQLEPILRNALEHYTELRPDAADITLVTPLHDVLAHETSLGQALTNLLTNAVKFVRPGERPQIVVRTEERGSRIRIWVEDNGIGIPPLYHERLFRIFERMPDAGRYEGTGVGLAIVRKIVEKVGGSCGVESDGETGSRFWLELDAAPQEVRRSGVPGGALVPLV